MLSILLSLACTPDQGLTSLNTVDPVIEGFGALSGRVCDPTGFTWLQGAFVYVNVYDEEGYIDSVLSTTTDENGYWSLQEIPAHYEVEIWVQKGDQIIESHELTIRANKNNTIDEPACLDPTTLDIVVVQGNYDDFDRVLDAMQVGGYEYVDGTDENVLRDFLKNPTAMAEYDLIFFNGGHVEDGIIWDKQGNETNSDVVEIHDNIRQYVKDGGSVYASDWSYDVITQIWPGKLDFIGAESAPDAAQLGTHQIVNAVVSNYALQDFLELESPYIPVTFDLPVWPPMVTASDSVSVHLTADVEYRDGGITLYQSNSPLLVSFNGGGGRVVFSSYRMVANDDAEMLKVMKYVMFAL